MNINNLNSLLTSMREISQWVEDENSDDEIGQINLDQLSEEDLADLSDEERRELEELINPATFLKHVRELERQCGLVINTNEGICRRVKEIFFGQYRFFRFMVFSGLIFSSVQLQQQWSLLQKESSLQTEQVQDLFVKSLIVGFLSGAICMFDSKAFLNCFHDKFHAMTARILSQPQNPQGIEEERLI